jgi:hypothetical protein
MPFEEFTGKGGRTRFGYPAITLLRSGGLSLNQAAFDRLSRPVTVVLAFDRDTRRIGVRGGLPQESFAYPVRKTSDDAYWVAAQSFLRYYGIDVQATERYRCEDDERYLVVDLNKEPVQREKRAVRKEAG